MSTQYYTHVCVSLQYNTVLVMLCCFTIISELFLHILLCIPFLVDLRKHFLSVLFLDLSRERNAVLALFTSQFPAARVLIQTLKASAVGAF